MASLLLVNQHANFPRDFKMIPGSSPEVPTAPQKSGPVETQVQRRRRCSLVRKFSKSHLEPSAARGQLLQADPGSTLRLLRLQSGKADRPGEENLPSCPCGSANWEPRGQSGAPPGAPPGLCWQTFPEISPSSNQCDGAKGIYGDGLLYPISPNFTLSPPLKELRVQCSEP